MIMKELWSSRSKATEFLKAFAHPGSAWKILKPRRITNSELDLPTGELLLIWSHKEAQLLPMAVVGDEQTLIGVMPKIMSFPGAIRPLSSVSKFWGIRATKLALQRIHRPPSPGIAAGLVGLIFSEIFIRRSSPTDFRKIGLGTVSRTFSFVCAQLVLAGSTIEEFPLLSELWSESSISMQNTVDRRLIEAILFYSKFANTLYDSGFGFDGSPAALRDALESQQRSTQTSSIQTDFLDFSRFDVVDQLRGASREVRFAIVEKILKATQSRNNRDVDYSVDLYCGYLISLLDPGSLDFLEMALAADHGRGSVACAYALCAGLLGKENFLWKYDGFGLQIYTNLLSRFSDVASVQSDISIQELQILQKSFREDGINFRTRVPNSVEVEVLPGVVASFSNGFRREPLRTNNSLQRDSEVLSSLERAEKLTLELQETIYNVKKLSPSIRSLTKNVRWGANQNANDLGEEPTFW